MNVYIHRKNRSISYIIVYKKKGLLDMKYTKEERLNIGREIYTHTITIGEAADKYDIDWYTARNYMRIYKDVNKLPPMSDGAEQLKVINEAKKNKFDDLESLSKDQLIDEVIKARIETERVKKGYTVKGSGQEKEFISLLDSNTK